MSRRSVHRFAEMKARGEPIVSLTAYDVLFAGILEQEEVDLLLVGDSLGQVVLGYDSTLPVTMEAMLHHGAAVRRGAPDSFVVLDLPFMSYQVSREGALRHAGRALKEAGADGVKVEGGGDELCRTVEALTGAGVPVMGHLGLTPQSVRTTGGYRVQGRHQEDADALRRAARALEAAGCFALVLELVPGELARQVTEERAVPTIGIGAGPHCDGQVLVLPDALGLNEGFEPRFLRRFAELAKEARQGVAAYRDAVREGRYPADEHTFGSGGG